MKATKTAKTMKHASSVSASTAVDPRDSAIESSARRATVNLSPKVAEDLRYFAKRRDEGRVISLAGLIAYFEKHHAIKIGRCRLGTLAREAGVEPWWFS